MSNINIIQEELVINETCESNNVCEYCKRNVGARVLCSFSIRDFSCFRGKKEIIQK
jgi:hypothetical protein